MCDFSAVLFPVLEVVLPFVQVVQWMGLKCLPLFLQRSSGSGTFSYEFARYEQAPDDVAEKQIEERASKLVDMEE